MAYATINFKNQQLNRMRVAPVGFSWTTLFFGFLPALFRKDWKWGAIQFVLGLLTAGISRLIFAFIYNKIYIKELIADGYTVENSSMSADFLSQKLEVSLPTK